MNRNIRTWGRATAAALAAAALLAACGGNDPEVPGNTPPDGAPTTKGSFTAVVSFGDSLSDAGTYAPATSLSGDGKAPYFGGKFTVNSDSAKVWVENLAATLGIALTPAEVGFAGVSQKCPAAAVPSLASSCTAYGQGGARVTDPNGIGKSGGALTVPVKTQIANHLARFGNFKASDLILVWAGHNDVFTQFGAFSVAATQIQTDAATGKISADEANLRLFQAQTAAQQAMKTAAQELTGYIRNEILAKGGKYVAVLNLVDISSTPFGGTLPASAKPVLTGLSQTFNLWLRDGLAGQPVKIVDEYAGQTDFLANPSKYGFAVINVPACDATKIAAITKNAIVDGSSLFCNGTAGAPYNGLRAGADVNTWYFADGVHPTPGGHKFISDALTVQLRAYGWIQ